MENNLTTEEMCFIIGCLNDIYNNAVNKLRNDNDTLGNIQKMIYQNEEKKCLELIIKLEGVLDKL